MGRKSKKKKSAAAAAATNPDEFVESALLEAWKLRYPSDDEDVAEQEVSLMRQRGHCCYAALQQGVQKQHFGGVSNFLAMPEYIDVATEALQNLNRNVAFMSLQDYQKPDLRSTSHTETMCKAQGETSHSPAAKSGAHGKPQTANESDKPSVRSTKPAVVRGHLESVKIGEAKGMLRQHAMAKATAEMSEQFDFDSLCPQGKQLYEMVLTDKIARLHRKLKHRNKFKEKKQRDSQPTI